MISLDEPTNRRAEKSAKISLPGLRRFVNPDSGRIQSFLDAVFYAKQAQGDPEH